MSRVDNKVQAKIPQPPANKPQVKQKAGEKSAFAQKLGHKPPEQKKTETKTSKPNTAKADSTQDQQSSTSMLQRQGAVFGRKGGNTLADLQAQLDAGKGPKSKGLGGMVSLGEGDALGKGAMGKDGLATLGGAGGKGAMGASGKVEDNLLPDQSGQDSMSNGPGNVVNQNQSNTVGGASQVVEIKGGTIPTHMLDKIVEQARVGVNSKGAPEFQFDLKGDVLGGLKMNISMDGGVLKASFLAENADIRRFIDGNLDSLRKSLAEKGINVGELEIRDPRDKQREQQNEQNQKQRQEMFDS